MSIFLNAEALHRENPDTFYAPTLDPEARKDLDALTAGDFIKVAVKGERFWAKIVSRPEPGKFTATVDNDLMDTLGLQYGSTITFLDCNIYDFQSMANIV